MFAAGAALVAVCAGAQAAAAQIPTSSNEIRPNYAADAKSRGAIELNRLVRCAMSRREKLAGNILSTRPGSNDQERLMSPFRKVMENCMSDLAPAMYLGNVETRGEIAGVLYLRQYPQAPDFAALAHPSLPLPKGWTTGKVSEYEKVQMLGQEFAGCIAATAPADVDTLLRTDLRSAAERTAFRRLVPSFGPCLPKGLKMELDVAWLRAAVAEAMLRNMEQWQSGSSSQKGAAG
ncbi:MAG: hypothetical protein ACKOOL_04500 [Novosphingobium sp.]